VSICRSVFTRALTVFAGRSSLRTASGRSRTRAPKLAKDKIIVVGLSGRGDKDVFTVANVLGKKL
jgi:tryptophan synthase beta subunit